MIASTVPVASSTPNSSRASSVVSRRETRLRTASVTTAACSRGPNADRGAGGKLGRRQRRALRAADPVQPMLAHPHRDRRQLGDLMPRRLGRVNTVRSTNTCAHERQRSGQCSTISSTCSGGSSRRYLPSCPCCPPRSRPEPFPPGRGGADGGSCDGGSDEFRELRFSRRSSSATRASSRSFASTSRWFASTSSSSRSNNPTAVSRSPSRIASASARSTQTRSPPGPRSLPHLNAYAFAFVPFATSAPERTLAADIADTTRQSVVTTSRAGTRPGLARPSTRARRAAHRRPAAGACARPRAGLARARARAMASLHRLSHHATALVRTQPSQTSEDGLSSAVRRRSAAEGGRSASQTRA